MIPRKTPFIKSNIECEKQEIQITRFIIEILGGAEKGEGGGDTGGAYLHRRKQQRQRQRQQLLLLLQQQQQQNKAAP